MDKDKERIEEDASLTSCTHQSEAPKQNKALWIDPHSKLFPQLTVHKEKDMFSTNATTAFQEHMKGKGKKIDILNEDEDDQGASKEAQV